jgi:uncharacterized membrane protein YkoI
MTRSRKWPPQPDPQSRGSPSRHPTHRLHDAADFLQPGRRRLENLFVKHPEGGVGGRAGPGAVPGRLPPPLGGERRDGGHAAAGQQEERERHPGHVEVRHHALRSGGDCRPAPDAGPWRTAPEPALSGPFSRGSASPAQDALMRRRPLLGTLAGLASSAALPAAAGDDDDEDDHERARAAAEAGRIRPLAELLAGVERRFVGRVVETELDDDDDDGRRWTYRFKLLPPSGRVYRVEVDAATGAVVGTRGPVQERR